MNRILLLTEVFPPMVGGSGRWLWELHRRLPEGRVVAAAGEHPDQERFDAGHRLRVIRMPLALPSWGLLHPGAIRRHWALVQRLQQIVRSEAITVVHCGKCLPEGLLALELQVLSGVPFICFVHGEELKLALQSRELTWWTRRVLGASSHLISNSHNTAQILREDWGIPFERIIVMHPGVDAERFRPATRDAEIRARFGWNGRPVLLTVGRLQKRKGHDRLIEALPTIKDAFPGILYSILGDGEERTSLEGLVDRCGVRDHVQFLGECDDSILLNAYQQCDVFILPNRSIGDDIEGFGMVLVEAQACGKPVVAGASGGTVETMIDHQTGYIIDCEDPGRIASCVVELLGDQERVRAMGIEARRWVVDRFDWEMLGRHAEQFFQVGIDRGVSVHPGGTVSS